MLDNKKNIVLSYIKSDKDLEILLEWINDKSFVNYNSAYNPVDYLSHKEWFERIRKSPSVKFFAIRKLNDELIGTCQLHSINQIHRTAELQIRISLSHTNNGYGFVALNQLIRYGFDDLNLNKIYLHVFENNLIAINLYKKLDFKVDGLLRDDVYLEGKYKNVLIMSLLKSEWMPK